MYKSGDVVVYRRDVCRIKDVKEHYFFDKTYYIMSPIDDDSLVTSIPVDTTSYLRDVITKEEAEELISKIPYIETVQVSDRDIEYEYKRLLGENTLESLIKIIKTTYMRNAKRLEQNKKVSEKDEQYFNQAERRLYNELSISLQLSFDDTKQYVLDSVEALLAQDLVDYSNLLFLWYNFYGKVVLWIKLMLCEF